ncbi:MAG: hypothetical protein WC484_07595 [Candidatus Omnitrophota bacterium]
MNQKTSLQKSLFSRLSLKTISLFTMIVFLCSDFLSSPSQALAQTFYSSNVQEGTGTSLLASAPATSGNVQELVIPSDIGTISEIHCGTRSSGLVSRNGENKNKSLVPRNESRFVVLIQDAHAVPDAQRSLQKLIEYLQAQYGVTTVALEGAEGKLDPELFRNFPDKEKLARVFESYLESGELSGAAVASVLSKFPAEYVGIEDWKLYQQGVAVFLKGLEQQAAFNAQRAELNEELKKLKTKYYSAEALEFDEKLRGFHLDFTKLTEMFKSFSGLVSRDPGLGKKYPALQAVMENLQNEQIRDSSALDRNIKAFASRVESRLKDKVRFNQIKQSFQTGHMGRSEFAYELSKLAEDPAPFSSGLQVLISNHEKLAQLKGPAFVKETEQFIADVKTKIFVSPEEKSVAELDEQLDLFGKFIKFELSRGEWNKIRNSGLVPQNLLRAVNEVAEKISALKSKTNDFQRFYQIAEKREAVFLKQLNDLLSKNGSRGARPKSRATSVVAFVAGGFHTDGLTQSFKKQGISYAVVSPRITRLPEENRYFDHMRGKA